MTVDAKRQSHEHSSQYLQDVLHCNKTISSNAPLVSSGFALHIHCRQPSFYAQCSSRAGAIRNHKLLNDSDDTINATSMKSIHIHGPVDLSLCMARSLGVVGADGRRSPKETRFRASRIFSHWQMHLPLYLAVFSCLSGSVERSTYHHRSLFFLAFQVVSKHRPNRIDTVLPSRDLSYVLVLSLPLCT